jgi:hypothetical protein
MREENASLVMPAPPQPQIQQVPVSEKRQEVIKPAVKNNTIFPTMPPPLRKADTPTQKIDPADHDAENVVEKQTDGEDEAKKRKDNVWRWTTIAVSCAGGLASGWLGSNMADQEGRVFKSNVQTIIGKASQTDGHSRSPIAIKMTGKTDRAVPLDENLCTVLELDRATGLTLAKPCKPIETTEFNSTLGKSDLLAKPPR